MCHFSPLALLVGPLELPAAAETQLRRSAGYVLVRHLQDGRPHLLSNPAWESDILPRRTMISSASLCPFERALHPEDAPAALQLLVSIPLLTPGTPPLSPRLALETPWGACVSGRRREGCHLAVAPHHEVDVVFQICPPTLGFEYTTQLPVPLRLFDRCSQSYRPCQLLSRMGLSRDGRNWTYSVELLPLHVGYASHALLCASAELPTAPVVSLTNPAAATAAHVIAAQLTPSPASSLSLAPSCRVALAPTCGIAHAAAVPSPVLPHFDPPVPSPVLPRFDPPVPSRPSPLLDRTTVNADSPSLELWLSFL